VRDWLPNLSKKYSLLVLPIGAQRCGGTNAGPERPHHPPHRPPRGPMDAPRWAKAPHDQPTCPSPPAPACYAHAPFLTGEKVLMGGFHAERKHKTGGPCIRAKPALRGRPRPPGWPLASPQASWVVWWRVRRRAWPGAASRYRPREKVPKNTYLEGPILTLPSYPGVLARVIRRPAAAFFCR
jgi:hypothetical protein